MVFKPVFNKLALSTVIYYIVVAGIVYYINASGNYKSGSCNPGLDLMSVVLAFFITCILLFRSAFLTFKQHKPYLLSFIIHLVVVIGVVICCFVAQYQFNHEQQKALINNGKH